MEGHRLMRPHVGRSYESRWQEYAYATVPPEHAFVLTAVTMTPKSLLASPAPSAGVVEGVGEMAVA